jgi:hypothetical protein
MQATLRGSVLARLQFLSGGVWMLDHPDVFAAFGTTADDVGVRFATWIRSTKAVQAWSQSAAWIPKFDTYDEYRQTPYESAETPDWFQAGLGGAAPIGTWHGPRLRAIAPEMWPDESMFVDIDLAMLNRIAECEQLGALTRIRLRADATLNDLERLFASRLPVVVTGLRS